jgi:hypothetical protein
MKPITMRQRYRMQEKCENQNEGEHVECIGKDLSVILLLKSNLKKIVCENVDRIHLAQNRIHRGIYNIN